MIARFQFTTPAQELPLPEGVTMEEALIVMEPTKKFAQGFSVAV